MTEPLPPALARFAEEQPAIWEAYQGLGKACSEAGPLDARTRRLVKLALAVGGGSEGAVHSHVRRALDEGLSPDALRGRMRGQSRWKNKGACEDSVSRHLEGSG